MSTLLAPAGALAFPGVTEDSTDEPSASSSPSPSSSDQGAQNATAIAEATGRLQGDLSRTQEVRNSARARYVVAQKQADKLAAEVKRNETAAADARRIVGQFARSIYMGGPSDLTLLASVIDTDQPGDLIRRADSALQVGESKDDEFRRAVEVLRRTQETKVAADAAAGAAANSLRAIDDQMNGLRRQLADVAGQWADHLAVMGTVLNPEQAARNSAAAAAWAKYLGRLADLGVPVITAEQLRGGDLPEGVTASRTQPGTAVWSNGKEEIVVLPERVVAEVTFAVSVLGTQYKWRTNKASAMDCTSLVDRAWNVPSLDGKQQAADRKLVVGGVRGQAARMSLLPRDRLTAGDVVFLADKGHGVDHVGVALDGTTMIASDAATGAVNALPISPARVWKVGRSVLPVPKRPNIVPAGKGKPWQCGTDPSALMSFPDGRVLSDPRACPSNQAVFGEFHMVPEAIAAGRCITALWPQIPIIGGWRPSDPYPDHPSGHAIDVMMPGGCSTDAANVAIGNSIAAFFMKHAKKFNLYYMIWQQRIWRSSEPVLATNLWRTMGNRGSCTQNHMDHVHITLGDPRSGGFTSAPAPTSSAPPAPAPPASTKPKPPSAKPKPNRRPPKPKPTVRPTPRPTAEPAPKPTPKPVLPKPKH